MEGWWCAVVWGVVSCAAGVWCWRARAGGPESGVILGGNCPLAPASLGGPNFYFLAVRSAKNIRCVSLLSYWWSVACSYPRVNSCNKSENRSLAKFDECQPQVPMLLSSSISHRPNPRFLLASSLYATTYCSNLLRCFRREPL